MSRKRHPLKTITKISTRFIRRFLANTKRQILWLLRAIFRSKNQQQAANAGFILPTVAMVSVVVVLLTTAIMLRSFDRAKNASNVRVNQAAISSATPAIDRGRAKVNQLFADRTLPRATPTDSSLYNALVNNIEKYTFGDETPLRVTFDINGNGTIDTSNVLLYNNEEIKTAWKFPVDTDNNGKFDSYNIYGIFFRTPAVNTNGKYQQAKNPLEARTPPMASGTTNTLCDSITSASLVGNTGWVTQDTDLLKSFFLYTATVPISSNTTYNSLGDKDNYEIYNGNKGFAAVEYQQDRSQTRPANIAVVYEDDISLTPGANFNLNGGVFTNSNFLTSNVNGGNIRFYQVSNTSSCFYDPKNAKITVGGNVALGGFTDTSDKTGSGVTIDLYQGKNTAVTTTNWVKSAGSNPSTTAYNNLAYVNRINKLIAAQMALYPDNDSNDPKEVQDGLALKQTALGITFTKSATNADFNKYRRLQLESYFKQRTRRVPYTEVAFSATTTETFPATVLKNTDADTGGTSNKEYLRPIDAWLYPTDPTDGKTDTNYAKVGLNISGTSLVPPATEPIALKNASGVEGQLGDRLLVGNNLPQTWWDKTKKAFVSSGVTDTQDISGVRWNAGDTTKTRTRKALVQTLADVGSTDRDGEWELAAARVPVDASEPVGGLRVVTGAGVYLNDTGTPSSFSSTITTVWPDTYPVKQSGVQAPPSDSTVIYDAVNKTIAPYWLYDPSIKYKWREIPNVNTPYLQMRATAVYHYKSTSYNAQTPRPIACVSSFYVPTNRTVAQNTSTLPWNNATGGLSNNGIVYPAPTKTETDYSTVLAYLKTLTYPNGRLIDDGLLAKALAKTAATRTISEQSAIDAQICALQIRYDSTFTPVTSSPPIPHGAIREIAFLDPREVEQNSLASGATPQTTDKVLLPSTDYNLPSKDRQPLEIRATVLDLNGLRTTTIGSSSPSQEYLLPNSGIIYATRDDALPDMSADYTTLPLTSSNNIPTEANKRVSPVDYKLDPTRRPNAIMLINGSNLERVVNYRQEEKGLILATNLPAYIKGDFNLHSRTTTTGSTTTTTAIEEFTTNLSADYSNFYASARTTLNNNFACRPNDSRLPNCTTGDQWRPATVLADAVSLWTSNFREGFRYEGDYDWNNSLVTPVPSGFSLSEYNSYGAVGTTWADTATANAGYPKDFESTITGYQGSSYVNNFVTPLMRWIPAREYAYEICYSDVESECFCTSTDTAAQCATKTKLWVVTNVSYNGYKPDKPNGQSNWRDDIGSAISSIKTGFIGDPPSGGWEDKKFRRIAVKRDLTTAVVTSPLTFYGKPTSGNKIAEYPVSGTTLPNIASPAVLMPWLKADSSNVLSPVLQINQPFATDLTPNDTTTVGASITDPKNWLQYPFLTSVTTANRVATFNLIVAAGDSPARASSEDNGGLHNFVRFSQMWQKSDGNATVKMTGSLMQIKKSAYASGPFFASLTGNNDTKYAIDISGGKGTGYMPPIRQWGYDVALLSQSPDLFASKLVLTPPDLPDEYFREVGRDDKWVQQLLCAKTTATTPAYAIDKDQRPSMCQS